MRVTFLGVRMTSSRGVTRYVLYTITAYGLRQDALDRTMARTSATRDGSIDRGAARPQADDAMRLADWLRVGDEVAGVQTSPPAGSGSRRTCGVRHPRRRRHRARRPGRGGAVERRSGRRSTTSGSTATQADVIVSPDRLHGGDRHRMGIDRVRSRRRTRSTARDGPRSCSAEHRPRTDWVGVHTHFSLARGIADRSYGHGRSGERTERDVDRRRAAVMAEQCTARGAQRRGRRCCAARRPGRCGGAASRVATPSTRVVATAPRRDASCCRRSAASAAT